mmetsp:Transcript_36663/g.88849  ORF Transcript_36663/g.88849 Transcript_36663/m.88849 type:complete len:1800 (-) Transcript_36663:303-5702(-)
MSSPPSFTPENQPQHELTQLEVDDNFTIIDSVVWGGPDTTELDELAARPKPDRSGDPCFCRPTGSGERTCSDLSCILHACLEECRSNCPAGDSCGNKRIQRREWKKFEVIDAGKKGRGFRLLEDAKKGDLITEYCGRAVNKKYLPRLFQRYGNERKLYIMALDKDIYLDARSHGSLARYINHACEPNCVVERWKVRGIVRAAVVAKIDIPAGTELSFDYQWERKRGRAPTKCHCGTPTCRGTLEVTKSMDELALEKKLNAHWKKPFMMRPQKEIVNRCVKIFSKASQVYFIGDVTSYDPDTGKHLIMYRHDFEEVWEELKKEDWMILDEEAQQFIIRKKVTPSKIKEESSSLLHNDMLPGMLLQGRGQIAKNHLYVPSQVKTTMQSKHLLERCQRTCRVTITLQQFTINSVINKTEPEDMEHNEKLTAISKSKDGVAWKLTILGDDISKAHAILEKNVAFTERVLATEAASGVANGISPSPMMPTPNRSPLPNGPGLVNTPGQLMPQNSTEVILPRTLVDKARQLLPFVRDKCRSVNFSFAPSESKSKQFAKIFVDGSLQSDVEVAKEHLWHLLERACQEHNAPKTPSGLYKDLCILGGEMSSRDFHNLLEYGKTDTGNQFLSKKERQQQQQQEMIRRLDAKEDLTKWSPFFASFEICQRCTIWVQSDSDKGRIDSSNRRVSEATPDAPRKIYFGCNPREIPKLWDLVKLRSQEVGRGVKYLYLGSDRLYQPMMMKNNGRFLNFVQNVTGANVTVDGMTGDHLRIDGRSKDGSRNIDENGKPRSEEAQAELAEELVRLQIEIFRDNAIRKQNWIFGRDWTLAAKKARGNSSPDGSVASGTSTSLSKSVSFDSKTLMQACVEIEEINTNLNFRGGVGAHAAVILYRYSAVVQDTQLKIREILLAAIFIANKAQKNKQWRSMELVLRAAYKSFYPGVHFDSKMAEVVVWEEKVLAAESEILESLQYDVFWKGFEWIEEAASQSGGMDKKSARNALILSVSGPFMSAGPEVWLEYGPDHIFAAAAGFLGEKIEPLFSALSLIPIRVMRVAEIISSCIKETGRKQSESIFEHKKAFLSRLEAINTTCVTAMISFNTANPSGQLSEREQRYRIIGDRCRKRRVYSKIASVTIKELILPYLDGISAESNCNIYIEQGSQEGFYDVAMEGSWRPISIASYLLDESVRRMGQLPAPVDNTTDVKSESIIQAKGDSGLVQMDSIETVDAWIGTIQADIEKKSFWGNRTGGKCCVPGKIKESDLRQAGLRWWLPPRYGPSSSGSICEMFLINNGDSEAIEALGDLTQAFQGESEAFSRLNAAATQQLNGSNDRYVALSMQRWPSEKVAKYEQRLADGSKRDPRSDSRKDSKKRSKDKERSKEKEKETGPAKLGFSPAALQEMQLLHNIHGLIKSPYGHPNFVLPVGVAMPSEVEKEDVDSPVSGSKILDQKRINDDIEDIFSLTRTSLENEAAAQSERKRIEEISGPHLVFHATPFVMQRFCSKHNKKEPASPTILAAWFNDLLSAMLHCHSNDIILRNFQGEQIVVDHSGVAKFAGFYRATVLSSTDKAMDIYTMAEDGELKRDKKRKDDEILNNPYAAPEILLGAPKFMKETDIWTLGCIFAHLLLGRPPFGGSSRDSAPPTRKSKLSAMYKIVGVPAEDNFREAAKFPHYRKPEKKYPPGVVKALTTMLKDEAPKHVDAIDLIDKMLRLDPRERVTAEEALQHKFMQDYVEQSNEAEFRDKFVNDWISLKRNSMRPNDEMEKERGIKRKAMLMAASNAAAESKTEDDDLYDMNEFMESATKAPKVE